MILNFGQENLAADCFGGKKLDARTQRDEAYSAVMLFYERNVCNTDNSI